MGKRQWVIIFLMGVALAGCTREKNTLSVLTHNSFAISQNLVDEFENKHNLTLNFIKGGDTGQALNRAILMQLNGTPAADVFYGLDNTFLSRALENDIFEEYQPQVLAQIPSDFQLDLTHHVVPIDYGDVCINYDKAWFSQRDLPIPGSLDDLTKPAYKGLLVVENPATSSPGLAFLLVTIAHFGEDGYLEFWRQLVDNQVQVVSDWEIAYYTNFSGSSGNGPQPMVVSYASSPAAEFIFAERPLDESPTASIIAKDTCFRQIEFAGILKGTNQRALGEAFIDFSLSKEFQEDMPLQMFVFPVLPTATLPAEFLKTIEIPSEPVQLSPELIAENRETWIQAWTDIVLGQ